ncbi:MAG: 16S rRNA (uracil(1498)-N(3))-methyltransferase [Bacteroidia bacterium]
MQLFYCKNREGNTAVLTEEESWHCVKVLRKKAGDVIHLIDGTGGFYQAILTDAHPKACTVEITSEESNYKKRNYHLHIAIAPTKNMDRIEWFAEKAVEIGVDEISFLLCKASERKVVKTERILRVVESAVKQSIQAYLPRVNELMPFKKFIEEQKNNKAGKLIAHCMEDNAVPLKKLISPGENVLCLIGPEGDFSRDEAELAFQHQYQGLSLGANRLRTETAGLYVCNALAFLNS